MWTRSLTRRIVTLAWLLLCAGAPAMAQTAGDDAAALSEVRHAFTLHGKPIPPEAFRDFGDGDIADSGSIWVTVDIEAAIGSNLYADDIKKEGKWLSQKKANQSLNGSEETGYTYIGATEQRPAGCGCQLQRRRLGHLLHAAHLGRRRGRRLRPRGQPLSPHQSDRAAQHRSRRPLGRRGEHRAQCGAHRHHAPRPGRRREANDNNDCSGTTLNFRGR